MPNEDDEHVIVVREETPLDKPTDLLSIIMRVVQSPDMDVAKMERLLDMQERIMADQRKTAFFAAMSRLQPQLPQIEKDGRIFGKNGTLRSKYASYEEIDRVIRPLYTAEGFAISFNSDSKDAKLFEIMAKISHCAGHFEVHSLMLPIDNSDYRTVVQNISSTISIGKRQLIKMIFNIVEKGEDTGAELEPITDDQVKDLETLIQDVKANKEGFLKFMGVTDVRGIRRQDLQKAINALEAKRKK